MKAAGSAPTQPCETILVTSKLHACVNRADAATVRQALAGLAAKANITQGGDEFIIDAEVDGESAKDLNRHFLSALRKVHKDATLRAQWTSPANLSGTPALPNGTTATTQTTSDSSTKLDTTAGSHAIAAATAPSTLVSSGAISVTAPNSYVICTTTCTVTPLPPVAGNQLCVRNAPGSATVITMAALGASNYYELTTHAGWGTANHTVVSSGVATDRFCIVGYDTSHCAVMSFTGAWTD
jgi:hypothetical protein